LTLKGLLMVERAGLLDERMKKQEKIIAKLQRQIEAARFANLSREENEVPC